LLLDLDGTGRTDIPLPLTETLTVNGVPPGTYTLRLRSANAAGNSGSANALLSDRGGPLRVLGSTIDAEGLPRLSSGQHPNVVWEPASTGSAATGYVLNVTGSIVASFPTTLRALSGPAGPGSYTVTVEAVNPCGSSPPTPPQTIVIP